MNWYQLCIFTENFAKLLDSGIMFDHAIEVASGSMASHVNRRFVAKLRAVFLDNLDLYKHTASYDVPPFYMAMLKCGQVTGRLPQALNAAGYYIRQLMPIKICLKRCIQFSIAAYLVSLLVTWIFTKQLPVWPLAVIACIFWLPVYVKPIRYGRDMLIAKLPFIGTWAQQSALMEFFLCMEITYDSTLSVHEMFEYSIAAMGNLYFRGKMRKALDQIDKRNSFADSLAAVYFVPHVMIAAVNVDEICGTMERSFHSFATELKKLMEAKLEVVKAIAIAIGIDFGLLLPLLMILPLFIGNDSIVILIIAAIMAHIPVHCTRMAVVQYLAKAAQVNLWWEGIDSTEGRLCDV